MPLLNSCAIETNFGIASAKVVRLSCSIKTLVAGLLSWPEFNYPGLTYFHSMMGLY